MYYYSTPHFLQEENSFKIQANKFELYIANKVQVFNVKGHIFRNMVIINKLFPGLRAFAKTLENLIFKSTLHSILHAQYSTDQQKTLEQNEGAMEQMQRSNKQLERSMEQMERSNEQMQRSMEQMERSVEQTQRVNDQMERSNEQQQRSMEQMQRSIEELKLENRRPINIGGEMNQEIET